MNDNACDLEFEALAAKVHQEVLGSSGINERTLVRFIITQHELSRNQNQFGRKLMDAGAEFDGPSVQRLYQLISNMHPRYRHEGTNEANTSTTVTTTATATTVTTNTTATRGTRRRQGVPREAVTSNQTSRTSTRPSAWARGAGRRRNTAPEEVNEPRKALMEPASGPTVPTLNHPNPPQNRQNTSGHMPSQPAAGERQHQPGRGSQEASRVGRIYNQQPQLRYGIAVSDSSDGLFEGRSTAATTAIGPPRDSDRQRVSTAERLRSHLREQALRRDAIARSQAFTPLVNQVPNQTHHDAGDHRNRENGQEHAHPTGDRSRGEQLGYNRPALPPTSTFQENTATLRSVAPTISEQPRSFVEPVNDTSGRYSLQYESELEELGSQSSGDLATDEDPSLSAIHDPTTSTIASTNPTTFIGSISTSTVLAQIPEQDGGLFDTLTGTIKSMADSPGATAMGVAVAAWSVWAMVSRGQGRRGWLR